MTNAKNIEQAIEFAKWVATPEGSAMLGHGLLGQPGRQGRHRQAADAGSQPSSTTPPIRATRCQKLWWWPAQPAWFIKLRGEYADKWKAA